MADSKQTEIFIIKREDHPVITDNDNAINAAKTGHLFYFQARVRDIGREPIDDLLADCERLFRVLNQVVIG